MTSLSCEQVRDLLPERAAGRQRGASAAELERHLAGCRDCRAEEALLAALREAAPPVPSTLEGRVLKATRQRPVVRVWAGPRQLALAATLVGAVIGGSLLLDVLGSGNGRPGRAGPGADQGGEPGLLLPVLEDPALHGGSVLSNLTEAELESLLATMES